jgi:transcriptional regulator with XRE-family HTH domain
MTKMTFGERMAEVRESNGWLQRDVASRMGVKANTISNWEKGISRPNLDQLCQLCQILSVTSDSLLGLKETPMERTLTLPEQEIIRIYRNGSDESKRAIFAMLEQFDHLQVKLYETRILADCATDFIEGSSMRDEWEAHKQEHLPSDDDADSREPDQ